MARVPVTPDQAREGSIWPMFVAIMATFLVVALTFWPYWGYLAVVPLLVASLGWVRENMRHHAGRAQAAAIAPGTYPRVVLPPAEPEHSKWWWGTVFLIVTEALLFVAGLMTLTAHPVLHDPTAPAPFHDLNKPLAAVASLVLWSSAITTVLAQRSLRKDRLSAFRWWLVGTIALAGLFVLYQIREYAHDINGGFTIASGAAGSIFYALTGLHGMHVLVGVLVLLLIVIHSLRGGITRARRGPAEAALLYWHFVEVVWIALYGILYLKLL